MLHIALIFLVVALVAALFGFGIAAGAIGIAKLLFYVCLALAAVAFALALTR